MSSFSFSNDSPWTVKTSPFVDTHNNNTSASFGLRSSLEYESGFGTSSFNNTSNATFHSDCSRDYSTMSDFKHSVSLGDNTNVYGSYDFSGRKTIGTEHSFGDSGVSARTGISNDGSYFVNIWK